MIRIFGAGGHAKVVIDALLATGGFRPTEIAVYDDKAKGNILGCRIHGDWKAMKNDLFNDTFFIAIGDNQKRNDLHRELRNLGHQAYTIIHPKAVVSEYVESIGQGSFIAAGAIVAPDAHLGHACIVNHGATIDHDCVLWDSVHVCPGAHIAGGVHIGDMVQVGIGASVKQGLSIAAKTTIGAGAAVVKDVVNKGQTLIGVPAKEYGRL